MSPSNRDERLRITLAARLPQTHNQSYLLYSSLFLLDGV
jgi:hypothetical protein